MAASTGIILATGAITMANQSVFHNEPIDWKVPIATGLLAITFAGFETVVGPKIPRNLALLTLVTLMLTRVNPKVPSPTESALSWWNANN